MEIKFKLNDCIKTNFIASILCIQTQWVLRFLNKALLEEKLFVVVEKLPQLWDNRNLCKNSK